MPMFKHPLTHKHFDKNELKKQRLEHVSVDRDLKKKKGEIIECSISYTHSFPSPYPPPHPSPNMHLRYVAIDCLAKMIEIISHFAIK